MRSLTISLLYLRRNENEKPTFPHGAFGKSHIYIYPYSGAIAIPLHIPKLLQKIGERQESLNFFRSKLKKTACKLKKVSSSNFDSNFFCVTNSLPIHAFSPLFLIRQVQPPSKAHNHILVLLH